MKKTIVNIQALTYTCECPLSFSEVMPKELMSYMTQEEYYKQIHSINLLLDSTITKSVFVHHEFFCFQKKYIMYHGTSDGIRCVNEYLNNNKAQLPNGHSITLVTTETPPFVCFLIHTNFMSINNE